MATTNKALEAMTLSDVEHVSSRFLMGWTNLEPLGFRLAGLNRKREEFGLERIDRSDADNYRLSYIREHYTDDEIYTAIRDYMKDARVGDTRWTGIDILDCRFGREYARLFKELIGANRYRVLAEELRNRKSMSTQMERNGGIGLAGIGAKTKAAVTNTARYGAGNVMQADCIKEHVLELNQKRFGGNSPFSSIAVRNKALKSKSSNIRNAVVEYKKSGIVDEKLFKQSPHEFIVMELLISRYGKDDVFYQYGLHPYDARYPYNCDFYVKSLDLFIELNFHYCHGNHWYNGSDYNDNLRLKHLLDHGSKATLNAANVWSVVDVKKRDVARTSGIKYLVFWDGAYIQRNKERVPRMSDFYSWYYDFDCDYESFVESHAENTY